MEKLNTETKNEIMPCGTIDKTISELKQEGWQYLYSFHSGITEQWNAACDKAKETARENYYEVVLVPGQTEQEKKDGVQYLFKRKTQKLLDWKKQHGY